MVDASTWWPLKKHRSVAAVLLLALAGCGGPTAEVPPEILLGADTCDYCRMVISETRHAAAARGQALEARFDDPGCLQQYLGERRGQPLEAWVHDEEGRWQLARETWLVRDPQLRTPMASGILAFSSRAAAEEAEVRLGGEVLRWPDL